MDMTREQAVAEGRAQIARVEKWIGDSVPLIEEFLQGGETLDEVVVATLTTNIAAQRVFDPELIAAVAILRLVQARSLPQ